MYNSENYAGVIWGENSSDPSLVAQRFKNGRNSGASSSASSQFGANSNEWKHITVVYGRGYTSIYVNGLQIAKKYTSTDLTTILGNDPTIYIGRANWSGGEYSDFVIDEFRIHNWGMTSAEVKENYKKIMG